MEQTTSGSCYDAVGQYWIDNEVTVNQKSLGEINLPETSCNFCIGERACSALVSVTAGQVKRTGTCISN